MRPLSDESVLPVRCSGGDARATSLIPYEEPRCHPAPRRNVPLSPYRKFRISQPSRIVPISNLLGVSLIREKAPPHCRNNLTPYTRNG